MGINSGTSRIDELGGLARQVAHFRQQAAACEHLGSPLYAVLLGHLAEDVAAGGVGARVLAGHEDDSGPSALALRVMAAVHRIVLTGGAPALAAHYPSAGGDGDADAAWPVFRTVLEEHLDTVRAGLAIPPQTNEVGRAAALWGGLLQVLATAERPYLPVRLHEIGSSGGLNLLADQFGYRSEGGEQWQAIEHPEVVLDPAWTTRPPGLPAAVAVESRLGCDPSPISAHTREGALALLSCVWPDQTQRLDRLRGALRVAQQMPVTVRSQGGGDFVGDLELADGRHTILWHSVMWQYVPAQEQQAISDRLEELGATATDDRTLTHLSFEPRRVVPDGPHRFVVAATHWPGGAERLLGEAPPHGVPVRWGDPRTS